MPTQNHPTPITLAARRMTAAAVVAEASGLGTLTAEKTSFGVDAEVGLAGG